MKIAYFAEEFPTRSETWIFHEIDALQNLGCKVRVFATKPCPGNIPEELLRFTEITTYLPDIKNRPKISVKMVLNLRGVLHEMIKDCAGYRKKAQVIRDLYIMFRIWPVIEAYAPDFLFNHFGGSRANLALFHSMILGIPFGFKMHAGDVFVRPALLKMKVDKSALVTTISDYNIKFISEHYPDVNSGKLIVNGCGLPVEKFSFEYKLADRSVAPTILSVGRLVKMKGFVFLLKAVALLKASSVNCSLVIVGEGPEQKSLADEIVNLNISDRVKLQGYASPSEVRKLLRNSDIFALPCIWDDEAKTQDGIPVALMEAMALGILVISTYTSGISELITDGENGFLAKPNDEASLSQKIKEALEQSESERERMLRAARGKIEHKHNTSKLSQELFALIESAIK